MLLVPTTTYACCIATLWLTYAAANIFIVQYLHSGAGFQLVMMRGRLEPALSRAGSFRIITLSTQEPITSESLTPNPLGGLFLVPCLPLHTRQEDQTTPKVAPGHRHQQSGPRNTLRVLPSAGFSGA